MCRSRRSFPFHLIVEEKKAPQSAFYRSRSVADMSIWINKYFPRLLVDVSSVPLRNDWEQRPEDYNRLLVQGASLVRLMNLCRKCQRKKEDSVLVVVFIDDDCTARQHVLFQSAGETRVCGVLSEPNSGLDHVYRRSTIPP